MSKQKKEKIYEVNSPDGGVITIALICLIIGEAIQGGKIKDASITLESEGIIKALVSARTSFEDVMNTSSLTEFERKILISLIQASNGFGSWTSFVESLIADEDVFIDAISKN